MIYTRHNSGVIFAGSGFRGFLHRWRMWRNDRYQRQLDRYNRRLEKDPEQYKRGFLNNQKEIDRHWDEDAPGQDFPEEPKKAQSQLHKPLRLFHNPAMAIFWR